MRLLTTQVRVIEHENEEIQNTNLHVAEGLQNVDTSLYVNRLVNLNANHTSSYQSHVICGIRE